MHRPAARACTNCRERKVRCSMEAGASVCRNCIYRDQAESCHMVKSRRGGKVKHIVLSDAGQLGSDDSMRCLDMETDLSTLAKPNLRTITHKNQDMQEAVMIILRRTAICVGNPRPEPRIDGTEHLALQEYYNTFHKSHPFLPDVRTFLHDLGTGDCPELLHSVLAVGYRLLDGDQLDKADYHGRQADDAIGMYLTTPAQSSLHNVQLYLVQSLLKFATDDRQTATQLLTAACDMIFTTTIYSIAQEMSNSEVSEGDLTLLRTVWEVWMCDIMFAALNGLSQGVCHTPARELAIPTPPYEHDGTPTLTIVISGENENPRYNIEYVDIWSVSNPGTLSSYAYLIAAFDLLRDVITFTNTPGVLKRSEHAAQHDLLDSKLVYIKSIAPSIMSRSARVNFMNFRTQMVIASETILLHAGPAQVQLPYFIQSPACGLSFESTSEAVDGSMLSLKRLLDAANDLVLLVKSIDHPRLAPPQLCCALSLSSYIHASATLLGLGIANTMSLQLERLWLQDLGRHWPTAANLADKVSNLISSFAIFDTDRSGLPFDARQRKILDQAPEFGLFTHNP